MTLSFLGWENLYLSIRQHNDLFPDFTPPSEVTGLELSLGNSSQDLDVYFEGLGKFEFEI
jgi:hypothetical protein